MLAISFGNGFFLLIVDTSDGSKEFFDEMNLLELLPVAVQMQSDFVENPGNCVGIPGIATPVIQLRFVRQMTLKIL